MKDYQKKAIMNGILVLTLLASVCMIAEAAAAERRIRPVRLEAPQATAPEEIVTGVCNFGGCPVATTVPETTARPEMTKEEPPQNLAATSQAERVSQSVVNLQLIRSQSEEPATETDATMPDEEPEPKTEPEHSGRTVTCWVTAYCGCYACSEGYGNMTATGRTARPNHTIAVDPNVIPYGTQVEINSIVYTAEDCGGGVNGWEIDVYFPEHWQTEAWPTDYYDVTIY